MGKQPAKKRPHWLKKDITPVHKALVRNNVGSFLADRKAKKLKITKALYMLPEFMAFLSNRSGSFPNVKKEDICTTDGTTGAIYDILRKKLRDRKNKNQKSPIKEDTVSEEGHEDHNTDWMKHAPPNPEPTITTPVTKKEQTPDTKPSAPNAQQEDEEEEMSEESGGGDEPEESEDASSENQNLGENKFIMIKQQFIGHIDVLDEKEAEWIYFEANLREGSCKVTTFSKAHPKSN